MSKERKTHDRFGDRLSFHGTIGTQSVLPFGTPDDVRPARVPEPEVPPENVPACIRA